MTRSHKSINVKWASGKACTKITLSDVQGNLPQNHLPKLRRLWQSLYSINSKDMMGLANLVANIDLRTLFGPSLGRRWVKGPLYVSKICIQCNVEQSQYRWICTAWIWIGKAHWVGMLLFTSVPVLQGATDCNKVEHGQMLNQFTQTNSAGMWAYGYCTEHKWENT